MANTNTPTVSTQKTVRIPLEGEPTSRNGSLKKDRRTVNFLSEIVVSQLTGEKDICLKKRPGTTQSTTITPGEARGTFNWQDAIYSVVGNVLYASTTAIITLATSTGSVGFTTFNGTSSQKLILVDGLYGYVINGDNTYTQIPTTGSFPSPHVPVPISMDGYLLVAGLNSNSIFNSNLEDPLTWTAGNFIDAEMYPDFITSLARFKNYFIAFGTGSMEFFNDPGTITSGSPFQRNDSAVKRIGTVHPFSISANEDEIVFVGIGAAGEETVYLLDGSYQLTEIADISVKTSIATLNRIPSQSFIYGYTVRVGGHKLYILNVYTSTYERTWVYDFNIKSWSEWEFGTGNKFPFNYSTRTTSLTPLLQHNTNGNNYELTMSSYTDFGTSIVSYIQTSKIDFDTINYKDHNRLAVIGDVGDATNSFATSVTCNVQWSDNDYTTFNTGRPLPYVSNYPIIHKLGKARRRAYKISFTGNTTYRINGIELDIDMMGT